MNQIKLLIVAVLLVLTSNSVFASEYMRAEQGFRPVVSLEKVNLQTSTVVKKIKTDLDRHVEQDLSKLTANRKTILSKP